MVEAVRVGTVIASDRKALSKWQQIRARRDAAPGTSTGLTGADLERTIGALAITHPDLVARV